MAAPATMLRTAAKTDANLSAVPSAHAGEPVALLPHNAKLHAGDVLAMRLDVDAATVGFWVNKKHIKDVHLNIDCAAWVPMASSCTPRVKFSLLTKAEQREARLWDQHHRQQIEEALVQGSKVLGAAGRMSEGRALAEALAAGHVHQTEQFLLWGVEPTAGWMEQLATPHAILTVRKTIRAVMGRHQRVKPGGVSVPMFNEKLSGKAAALEYTKGPKTGSKAPSRMSTASSAQSPTSPLSLSLSRASPDAKAATASSPAATAAMPTATPVAAPAATATPPLSPTSLQTPASPTDTSGEGGGRGGGVVAAPVEEEEQLWHPVLAREQEARQVASVASQALAHAAETLAHVKRSQLACAKAVREVEEGAKAYAHFAASDFSVAVSQQNEVRRLQTIANEAQEQTNVAQAAVDKLKHDSKLAKKTAAEALCQAKRLLLRRDLAVLGLYVPVRHYLASHTTKPVTFSAADNAAAAQAKKDQMTGRFRGVNETSAAKVEPHSGNVVVFLMTATQGARIFYSLDPWDNEGNPPKIDERSASCTSGAKVTLSKSGHVTAFASYASLLPSEVHKS